MQPRALRACGLQKPIYSDGTIDPKKHVANGPRTGLESYSGNPFVTQRCDFATWNASTIPVWLSCPSFRKMLSTLPKERERVAPQVNLTISTRFECVNRLAFSQPQKRGEFLRAPR